MTQKIHGTSSAQQNLTADVPYFIVYAQSDKAYTDPENAEGINILVTNNIHDISQKNFEILLQSIGLRAMPVIMNNPVPVANLAAYGAPTLIGEGFVWKFACEMPEVFTNYNPYGTPGTTGLLVDELDGIILPSGTIIRTYGSGLNIEFVRSSLL
ncbi:hypothetical protein Cassandra_0031 [Pseudomonas phage Cassandra]|uniref:Structural protein n=1 Tax=Pseudomonas phage vB_PaeM_PA5oct TaxID=2163605 RepID=A0A4Y1LUP5_9CAUD|nr:structural protein [Pseudomonas phage vB_PaeM_PA5oct]QCG76115.1 structural protein [Pseudomonas phage vB_PaeM_PA5oct]WPK38707.1 hypothetical protein Cassandra_0031 [Pseudomonas phage Cassandra]WPK39228.1 hypothetical protein Deiofobo_0031 [Pseudomonas phage Deifobo]WPK40261.1 hypothetical protein Paride_0031 [Pseudomonas phage Paride]